jgi:hypothetical protein
MSHYLVQGETSREFALFRILAPVVAVLFAGLILCLSINPREEIGVALAIAVAICVPLVTEGIAMRIRRTRTWIVVDPDGFDVIRNRSSRHFLDGHVRAIAYSVHQELAQRTSGSVRECTLWVGDDGSDPETVRMTNWLAQAQSDPLAGFLRRLMDRLHADAETDLDNGESVEGEGWRIDRAELIFRRGKNDEVLPMSEFASSGTFDGALCVWRHGSDVPHVRFPLGERNVWLLDRILQSRIPTKRNEAPAVGSELGRVLFERGSGVGFAVFLLLIAAGLVVAAAVIRHLSHKEESPNWARIAFFLSPFVAIYA